MTYSTRPVQARLDAARRAICGALANPEVLALLSACSYDRKALRAGKALYENACVLGEEAVRTRARQYGATEVLNARLAEARKQYARDLTLARIAIEDPAGSTHLGLKGARARALVPWLAQARQFYDALQGNTSVAARLRPLGINEAVLEARQAALEALTEARLRQASAKGEAQELTHRRREAMAALDAWMRRFLKVAPIALEEKPQLMEVLGLRARS